MKTSASIAAQLFAERDREARRLARQRRDRQRQRIGDVLRERYALEYLLSPGDPTLCHDQQAMADALRTIANGRRTR
jgi:hypothetical protein